MIKDKYFNVETIRCTQNPQQLIWYCMHQDHSSEYVVDEINERGQLIDEKKAGNKAVEKALKYKHDGVCYDENTEVLTKEGWKFWENVTNEDYLLAVDINSNTSWFEKPSHLIKYEVDEKLLYVHNPNVDFAVTLNHRVIAGLRKSKIKDKIGYHPYAFIYAKDLLNKTYRVPKTTNIKSDGIGLPKSFFKLAGFFVGDGCKIDRHKQRIRFHLRLERKINYLYSLGYKVDKLKYDAYSIHEPEIALLLSEFFYNKNGKTIPSWMLDCSTEEFECFMEGLKNSDGTHWKQNPLCFDYDSTSINVLNNLQALIHIHGLCGNIVSNGKNQNPNSQQCYRITIHECKKSTLVQKMNQNFKRGAKQELIDYSGMVYCATVSTGALMVRRNNKVVISGNCEHPQISFNCGYFPHTVMVQGRTHRHTTWDCQCLSGDTEITFQDVNGKTNHKAKKSMSELYDLWHNGEKAIRTRKVKGRNGEPPGQYRRDAKSRIKKMRVRSLNEENNIFIENHIKDVVFSGLNPVYKVTLEDGKTLKCTQNHKIYTPDGWKTLSQIYVGTEVMVNGKPLANAKATYQNKEKERTRNPICSHPKKVINIEYIGVEATYDLVMEAPHHNFVANGIVVHNSMRYSSQHIIDVALGNKEVEKVFYFRPEGYYQDRKGKKYYYSQENIEYDKEACLILCQMYYSKINKGFAEEHCRDLIPQNIRQHFFVSMNARALFHFINLRIKKDAQLEIQALAEMMAIEAVKWMPEISEYMFTKVIKLPEEQKNKILS